MSVYLNGVDITATTGALVIHDTDIKADLGDFSAQTHLKTALAALGIPDVSAKPLYTCLVTDRLDNATYGLGALDTDLTTIINDLANGTDGLGALKTLLVAIPTTMVGTDDAALAATLEDAMQKATDPAYNQDTDSQEAIAEAVSAIPTVMVGTNSAALASSWTAALATALANYTAVRAAYLDSLYDDIYHLTYIFPAATNLTCTLTAHADANDWSAWVEVADSATTKLSSVFAAADGHVSAMVTHEANQDDTDYMVDLAYGDAKAHLSQWRIHSQTNKISSSGQSRCRGAHIPAGEKVYARVMCATAGGKTLLVHFRWWLHP